MLLAFIALNGITMAVAFAMVLIALLVWGAWNPMIWRVFSVLGMATGAGFLVWGILMASMNEEPPFASPAGIIAIGAGVLVGSIALLVISFCGRSTGRKG